MTTATATRMHPRYRALADRYTGRTCSLNGRAALILGRFQPFATVAVFPDGPAFEFSWETVARVMETREGRFEA
jgi:hypothetical protein